MRLEVHTDAGAFHRVRAEWDGLLPRSHGDTLFQRPAWLGAWWQVFGSEGTLRLVTVRDHGGRLVGVAPFFLASVAADATQPVPNLSVERPAPDSSATMHRALMLVGGTEVSDYLDLVIERGQEDAVYAALCRALTDELAGWEWMDLHGLPEGSPTPAALGRWAAQNGLTATLVTEDVCPYVTLPDSWPAYLRLLGRKERHELRRKMNKLALNAQVAVRVVSDAAELEQALPVFIALHEASATDKADFMRDPRMRRFFGLIAQEAAANGWLDLSFLSLDGEAVASVFCFRYGDAVLVYNSGFLPQAWPSLSPGIVLLGLRIQQAIADGQREFDFLQGNERYKYDLGGQDRIVQRLFIRRP